LTKTKYWLSLLAISVVLVAGSLAVSPIAIAGDDEDDEEGDDDACSPDFTCIRGDDEDVCPAGFTCEEECDDGDDCELKECEVNGDDDGICVRPVGPVCDPPEDPFDGNLRIFVNDGAGNGFCGIECEVWSGQNGCPFSSSPPFAPFVTGTTDQLGNLSFDIPPEELHPKTDEVTVVCDLSGVGGLSGFWYFVDVPMTSIPNPPFDFNINDGTNMCCPGPL